MTCQSEPLLKGLSGGPASQSINFLSGSHQAAIWRLTRALSHGALQLSGAPLVHCVELPVMWRQINMEGNNDLQLVISIRQITPNVKGKMNFRDQGNRFAK